MDTKIDEELKIKQRFQLAELSSPSRFLKGN
jgi:hypothetical protein